MMKNIMTLVSKDSKNYKQNGGLKVKSWISAGNKVFISYAMKTVHYIIIQYGNFTYSISN